ncbi:MAG: caspase family protein [Bacteroidota bacterium]
MKLTVRSFCLTALFLTYISLSKAYNQTAIPKIVINSVGHSGKVFNVLYTPDGSKIISVSEDKSIRVWDASSGELLNKYESEIGTGPKGMLYSSAITPDGKILAVSGYPVHDDANNYIIFIDLNSGKQVSTAVGHKNVINSLDFTGDGKYLASGSDDGTILIWQFLGEEETKSIHTIEVGSRVAKLSFNKKSNTLVVASESKNIKVYNLAGLNSGTIDYVPRELKKHKGIVSKVSVSPDGSFIASSSFNQDLLLWRSDGSYLRSLDTNDKVINALAFSHDSRILVAMDETGKGISFNIPSGNKLSTFSGHDNTVFSAAFSPNSISGSYLACTAGGNNNVLKIWNPINGKVQQTIQGKGSVVWDLEFGDGLDLYIKKEPGTEKYGYSFDFKNFSLRQNPDNPRNYYSEAANSNLIQISPYEIEINRRGLIQNDEFEDGRILDFQATKTGNIIVGSDFSLKMYSSEGLLMKEFLGHTAGVRAVTVTKDSRYLASGGEDQTIKLWKLDESGVIPSMKDVFQGAEWIRYFGEYELSDLIEKNTAEAWKKAIATIEAAGDKTSRDIQGVYENLGETITPFANLFVSNDSEWISWVPTGYFNCSSAGGQYFGWHINRGIRQLADFYTAEQYFEILYRPKVLMRSVNESKRVDLILQDEGEQLFDLGKLERPSAAFFNLSEATIGDHKILDYQDGGYQTKAKSINLEVDLYNGGGGLKELNIYQNNKLIITDGELGKVPVGKTTKKFYDVNLTNGPNEFKVIVKNNQRIESRPNLINILYNGDIVASSDLFILAVGINEYKNPAYNLNYAQPDAKSFVSKITKRSGKIFRNVRKLEIYDKEATKENIERAFKSIVTQAKPEDVFVFYYAGHGTLDEDNDDEYYFVPTDVTKIYGDPDQLQAKAISSNQLKVMLADLKPQKQLILMDACHSEGALKAIKTRAPASEEKAIVQLARASGVVMIASSGTQQYASEFEVLQHGVFTYSLLEALDGKLGMLDNRIMVGALKSYMEFRVPELAEEHGGTAQYPTGYTQGNDFPIGIIENN